jgi:hypothetical protein
MQEASSLPSHMQKWKPMGIRFATLLVNSPTNGTATVSGAQVWKQKYNLIDVDVMADPGYAMVAGSSVGTPQTTLVNPRTMKVVLVQQGYPPPYATIESLAVQNGG